MGSKCCKQKEDSPGVSLGKVFARCSRIFPHAGRTVKINEYDKRERPSVSDPIFISSTNEERNHVTLLLPDAPRVPPRKKKPRLSKKRVSFQSDVDIMRMSSSKSLDSSNFEWDLSDAKPRARSLDSLLGARDNHESTLSTPLAESHPVERRTSSLDRLPARLEEWPGMSKEETRLTARLRRDTLGNALDIHGYRRPVLDTTLAGTLEEESEDSLEDVSSALSAKLRRDTLATITFLKKNKEETILENLTEEEVDSSVEDLAPSKLNLKLRRDTLGIALTLRPSAGSPSSLSDSVYHSAEFEHRGSILEEGESSTEDLAKKVSHSKLCMKLRRDTFGDALKQAVKNKACSSFEDITDLEIHGAEMCWCEKGESTKLDYMNSFKKREGNEVDSVDSGTEKLSLDSVHLAGEKQNESSLKDLEKEIAYIDEEQVSSSGESLSGTTKSQTTEVSNGCEKSSDVTEVTKSDTLVKESDKVEVILRPKSTTSRRKEWLNSILSEGNSLEELNGAVEANNDSTSLTTGRTNQKLEESAKSPERNNNSLSGGPVKKVLFTEAELTTALKNMRTSPKAEDRQAYTLVYASPTSTLNIEVPSISVTPAEDEPSLSESLKEFETSIYDMLQSEEEQASNSKQTSLIPS